MVDPRTPDYASTPGSATRPAFSYEPADGCRAGAFGSAGPLVSIVTPFFNACENFRETARCVLGQSLARWEWIIINDASTDAASLRLLDEFRGFDPRIRVIDLPRNGGPSAARNAGFAAAVSEYVYQLDADDLIEPTMLEKCFWFLLRHSRYSFVSTYEVGFGSHEYLWTHGFHEQQMFLSHCPVGSHTVMVRKSAHKAVGGYDESIRGGMEDWDFWLRAASRGLWGATMPEFLAWYRRRESHAARWADWDGGERQRQFAEGLKARYPSVFAGQFPVIEPHWHEPFEHIERELPADNVLAARPNRLLLIAPWVRMGGADKFNLDLVEQLTRRGWEVTIACTVRGPQTWLPDFARLTPDIFLLHHFLRPPDHPLFLRYLIESRRPDVVVVSNSELGYLALPYLRSVCPEPVYVDYVHMEETYWKNGGYARYSVGAQGQLDRTMVTSEHLRSWMVERGADGGRIEPVYINVDPARWAPDAARRRETRSSLGIVEHGAVLLFAGRLTAQKQPRVLVETARRLRDGGSAFTLLIAGDGEDRAFLESFIREHDLGSCVRMLGETTPQRVAELMNATDIFFLPSLWEGVALVLYEAMAAGVTFVGADVGGQRELCPRECGVLLPRLHGVDAEAAAYAAAIRELLSDPARRRAMGEAARRRICEHFRLEQMGDAFLGALARAARDRLTAPRIVLPEALSREIAERGVEFLRVHDACDQLWHEREAVRARGVPQASQPGQEPFSQATDAEPREVDELREIECSRAWRTVQAVKGTAIYKAWARVRYGPSWNLSDPAEPAAVRLARIKTSRSYKLIQALKETEAYKAYAEHKYGKGGEANGVL